MPAAHDARRLRGRRRRRHLVRRPGPGRGGSMSRLNEANTILAKEIIGRYPKARSATIPLLHLSQQQNGYITNDAIAHIAELVGATSAEVLGTCTFYEMFKMRAGRQVPHQHLRHHELPAAGCRRTDAPRRADAGREGRRHHRRRHVHARARRVPGRLHRGAEPAGQLPPLPPDDHGGVRSARSTTCAAGRLDGDIPAARHARLACASSSPPTGRRVSRSPDCARSCPPGCPDGGTS